MLIVILLRIELAHYKQCMLKCSLQSYYHISSAKGLKFSNVEDLAIEPNNVEELTKSSHVHCNPIITFHSAKGLKFSNIEEHGNRTQ